MAVPPPRRHLRVLGHVQRDIIVRRGQHRPNKTIAQQGRIAQQVQAVPPHVAQVSTVRPTHHRVATSLQVAMERVQVRPVRRCVVIISTLMLVHRHARPVRQTIITAVQRRHRMQAVQVVRLR